MFTPITHAALLRIIKEQGSSRCGGTFAPQFKAHTVQAIQRKIRKLRWPISVEELSWGYDVLGGGSWRAVKTTGGGLGRAHRDPEEYL